MSDPFGTVPNMTSAKPEMQVITVVAFFPPGLAATEAWRRAVEQKIQQQTASDGAVKVRVWLRTRGTNR